VEADPFVCSGTGNARPARRYRTLGNAAAGRVARSYLTPARGWQTIWRTLANPGE